MRAEHVLQESQFSRARTYRVKTHADEHDDDHDDDQTREIDAHKHVFQRP